uniref:Uncharacterized protein n=1 Tax=Arundo donax TaxID=35708 RepID=A0A0A9BWV6_ARUDO
MLHSYECGHETVPFCSYAYCSAIFLLFKN